MASFAGWYGRLNYPQNVLKQMADSMDGLNAVHEQHVSAEFAVRTTQPGLAGDIKRIAVSEDGQTVVAFAGYLYTEDDSARRAPAEHCLRLYRQHGLEFPTRLNGTFTVVVADATTGQLHLVTDRLSTRPVFYTESGDGLLFASEVKGLLQIPGRSRTANPAQMAEFLALQCVPGCVTYYDDITQVPPASILSCGGPSQEVRSYWQPEFTWREDDSLEQSAERMAEAFRSSVRRICSGHDQVALMLSGGLDSRAIAAACHVAPECLTMHTASGSELQAATAVAAVLDYPHRFVRVPETYPLELLHAGSLISDGLGAFHHAQSLYLREATSEIGPSVILNGYTLNTMCSGSYIAAAHRSRFLPPRIASEGIYGSPTRYLLESYLSAPISRLSQLMGDERANAAIDVAEQRLHSTCTPPVSEFSSAHDAVDWLTISNLPRQRYYLNMRALGRITMEGIPGLDCAIIDTLLATPPAHRFNHTAYRRAISALNLEVARIPYTETGVPVHHGPLYEHWQRVFKGELRRAKNLIGRVVPGMRSPSLSGAWPDIGRAMVEQPEWHALLREYARSSRLADMGLVNGDTLREIVEAQISGTRYHVLLLGTWLTLEQWLNEYG